jgi:non-heme chloroperoxidase
MPTLITKDGTEIFYKDWGDGQPIVFHHGWPLSSDDWDTQMMFFMAKGYRVIAHDRRGHGRSSQGATGHDMDTYVADAAHLYEALDLRDAIHIGHSTGGGEVARYVANQGQAQGRVAKAVLISAVAPIMVKSATNPGGLPIEVLDGVRQQTAANRAQFFWDFTLPFYGYNREGAEVKEGVRMNWWRQGMMGGAKAHYDGIAAFSETDFTEDLKRITVPTLVLHGEDDQVVPFADAGPLSAAMVKGSVFKSYPGLPHGMPVTHADLINADLLAFIEA